MTAPSCRRLLVLVAALAAGVVAIAVAVVLPGSGDLPAMSVPPLPGPASAAGIARQHEIEHLLKERSAAVLDRDRGGFMATLDPQAKTFRRTQSRMFADIAAVPIRSWSYSVTATRRAAPPNASRYGAPTWAPEYFALHYRLDGFDPWPTTLQQYPTFVERGGRWYLASLTDYAPRHLVSATDIWDYGPVKVLRRPGVLVLGSATQTSIMTEVARQVRAAIDPVTAVWGRSWARRAVVLVPATMHEMALIDGYRGDLRNLAALTSAEVSTTAGSPAPVGDRITVNPVNWPRLSEIGASVVIRHELTHVATRAATGTQTPTWLSEGFADYVGFRTAPVSVAVAAAALDKAIAAGRVPDALPTNRDFRSSNPRLAVHYESAWLACRFIADHYGERALVGFYRDVGTSPNRARRALADALRDDLHLEPDQFVGRWRRYIENTLG
ncbi:MAG TPA: hypothetical protein VHA79_06590 [Mycobacteriales bacterium]|nr:hypothetical protein [Mycobacteriales bacterium]HVX69344.1 hypothetical protein [Mycobacteriales bacterium]